MRETGIYRTIGAMQYFIPHSLPVSNPPLLLNNEIVALYGEASFALGQLNEMSERLPDFQRFIKAYVMKEALLSSAIENIHTTLIDVFTGALPNSDPNKNTQLVIKYTKALDSALNLMQEVPLGVRVILAAHEALLSGGEEAFSPGMYRRQSVHVGDLIPPPAIEVADLIGSIEKYIHNHADMPALIQAGLVHVQFETIHPFLDGNGRIGRLLIVLMLLNSGLLRLPIIYPSYYFKKHRAEYYQRLDRVRTDGDFEGWVAYYLRAIRDSAIDAYTRAKEIEQLEHHMKEYIDGPLFIKMRATALHVLDKLFIQPIISISEMSQKCGRAYNTIAHIFAQFVSLGIISESNEKRGKLFRFEPYLEVLGKDYSISSVQ